jgi:2-polyprenyl-3-methyl-5-hydroxy-6-metoxy-1,4-benzoquinol methylase
MGISADFWDTASANYDKTEERFEHIHTKSREYTKKHLKKEDRVLDYGCGTGTTSCAFADLVGEIEAIDISGKMIDIANKKRSLNNIKNIGFYQRDIFDKSYANGSFDVVLAFNVLHTIPEPDDVVDRIHQLLKPDGLFISVTPCLGCRLSFAVGIQVFIMRIMLLTGVIPVPIRRLKSQELDELIEKKKFQSVATEMIYKGASSYFVVAKKSE